MIKKNEKLILTIESVTNLGFGVARHEGIVVFISGAVTGDTVEAKIIKTASSYAVGKIERFVKKSQLRVDDRCTEDTCSSCAYKSINYSHELEIKKSDVASAFAKAGMHDVKIAEVVASPKEAEYRNKAQYPIAMNKNGDYVIGFYAPKSHRVTDAQHCPLATRVFSEIIEMLKLWFKKESLSVYDEENGKGLLRHIYLRRGEVSGEILLTLVINGDFLPNSQGLIEELTANFPALVGILININKENTNVILGDKYVTLYGRDYIYDILCDVKLKLSAPAFYQVNHGAAELLYNKAKELAMPKKTDTLLDLYCGVGSIGLSMAKEVSEIIGIEIVDSAVICARENADNCEIKNAYFYTGDAADTEKLLDNAETTLGRKIEPDIVILDPPRAGCSENLISFVSKLNPKRIVYISCNPTTLARDAALFHGLGYEVGEVTPFDLFPMTGHVESVVCLTRE